MLGSSTFFIAFVIRNKSISSCFQDESREKAIAETVREYAKIQYAIMAGEKADYNEALKVLGSMRSHSDNSHISELAESVAKSIEILKREIPKDENK